ncbi:MAG: hypothetical protein LBG21_04635 [Campylobacteraceae bacterium]|nr:hypothetical protein [Campylobacteraceae bacterium]
MILYDKNTVFLGVSADILSALGYENINVFRAYNNDIADLFVKKQGYVHKFDNFSWISYVLNGSLPNKNVIIKTRNGSEIEASISVTELFLNNKDDKCYIISLNNIRHISDNSDSIDRKDDLRSKQPIFKIDDENIKQPVFAQQQIDIDDNKAFNENNDKVPFSFSEDDLKIVSPAINETDNLTQNKIYTEDTHQSQASKQNNAKTIEIKIDIQEISDLLGINKTDIVKYFKEYVYYLDASLEQLQNFYENGSILQAKHTIINLIGIGSNLRSKELVQELQKLLSANNSINNVSVLQELETIVSVFKQSVSKL